MRIAEEIIAGVRSLATEHPFNIYVKHTYCCYTSGSCTDGSKGCIFGQALKRLGFNLGRFEGQSISIRMLLDKLCISYSESEGNWMESMQANQDDKHEWGTCLLRADTMFPQ